MDSTCTHCGLPVAGKPPAEGEPQFCCSGCCVAHYLAVRGAEGSADRMAARLALSAFLAMGVMVFSLATYGSSIWEGGSQAELDSDAAAALDGVYRLGALALATPVVYLLGLPLLDAVLRMRRFFSADALILVGAFSAYVVSAWNTFFEGGHVYLETATMVLVLVGLGRWLDTRAKERARCELSLLLPEREPPARRVANGVESEVPADQLALGDLVRVLPGEWLPVDGVVVEGRSFVDSSALTGEAEPVSRGPGDAVLAGGTLVDGTLLVSTEATGGGRVRDEVERLLVEALGDRGRFVRLADRVAGALLPIVLLVALGTLWYHWRHSGAEAGLMHALAVLLISCPCALGIATPLAFWAALSECFHRGALVRGSEVLERLASAKKVFFDKTGTLTDGELELVGVEADDRGVALAAVAALERHSEHPVGHSLRRAWRDGGGSDECLPQVVDFRVLPGRGVEGVVGGATWRAVRAESSEAAETVVDLFRGDERRARFRLRGRPRPEAREVVTALAKRGLAPSILTGDHAGPARAVAQELGIEFEADLLPADKFARIEAAGVDTVFVGDGLNDAAALAAARVGVAVSGGSARSLDVASVNLLRPGLGSLPDLFELSRTAVRTAKQNLAWAFGYNAIGLCLAAIGRLSPIFAASAMVVSSVVVVLNSARIVRRREGEHASNGAERRPRVPTRSSEETVARRTEPA
ncbi:MAG: cadmium-translocating P-type ATPase [Planctomycetes bacterium]|nr:cadmium-translocating P-type ATPase [Planctomycetota bacterium]